MKDLKYIILGIVVALIVSVGLSKIFMGGLVAVVVGFLIAGIIVGYLTSGDTKNIAINGMVVGFVGGIILILFVSIMNILTYSSHANAPLVGMFFGTLTFGIIAGIIFGIISAIGSLIGCYVKSKT